MGQKGSKPPTTAPFPQGYQNGPPPNRGDVVAQYGGPRYYAEEDNYPQLGQTYIRPDGTMGVYRFEDLVDVNNVMPTQATPVRRRPVRMDDEFWEDDDPVYLPEPRRRRFDPFEQDPINPRPGGVRQRGLAGDIIDNMKRNPRSQTVEAGRVDQYRAPARPQCFSPQQCAPPQPRITKYTTYVDEPRGYVPPGPSGSVQFTNTAPQLPQYTMPQAQMQAQAQPNQKILYYDPKTGAITGEAGGQPQQPQQTFQTPQGVSYVQPQQLQQQYVMPQQAQPIVIPGSLYTGSGQVQRLG